MKKTNKPATKKPAAKKSPKKLKRKAELAALVEQFTTIADRLEQAVNQLASIGIRHAQSNDDLEFGGRDE
jgi:hypothetical protein